MGSKHRKGKLGISNRGCSKFSETYRLPLCVLCGYSRQAVSTGRGSQGAMPIICAAYMHTYIHTYIHTDRQTYIQTYRD